MWFHLYLFFDFQSFLIHIQLCANPSGLVRQKHRRWRNHSRCVAVKTPHQLCNSRCVFTFEGHSFCTLVGCQISQSQCTGSVELTDSLPAKLHHEIRNVTAIQKPLWTLSLWSFSFQFTCHFRICLGVCASWCQLAKGVRCPKLGEKSGWSFWRNLCAAHLFWILLTCSGSMYGSSCKKGCMHKISSRPWRCQEERYAPFCINNKWFLLSLLYSTYCDQLPTSRRPGSSFHKDFRAVPLPKATRPTNGWHPWRVHSSGNAVW